jgi:hypothetical protein
VSLYSVTAVNDTGMWELTYTIKASTTEKENEQDYKDPTFRIDFVYTKDGNTTTCKTPTVTLHVLNPNSAIADKISSLLQNSSVYVPIFTVCAIVFVRTGLKVFRFGVKYKSNFVTVEDNDKFKEEMRQDSRASKQDMQDSLLKICLREIARETKPFQEMQNLTEDLKTRKTESDIQMKQLQDKYNSISDMQNQLQTLERTVHAIQYGDNSVGERRSGK